MSTLEKTKITPLISEGNIYIKSLDELAYCEKVIWAPISKEYVYYIIHGYNEKTILKDDDIKSWGIYNTDFNF